MSTHLHPLWCTDDTPRRLLQGKRVAVVASGPGANLNPPGLVDSYDVVVRVNNYKLAANTGQRTDVLYSFFGSSVTKSAHQLKHDGVQLCMCKCPDAKAIDSPWHERHHKPHGVDFRYIYQQRRDWWFCPTWVPSLDTFLEKFHLLGRHIPTTGFAAVLDVLAFRPAEIYCTGFDFFTSGIHNLDEPWRAKNSTDPIGHAPDLERQWFALNVCNPALATRITTDEQMHQAIATPSNHAADHVLQP